MSKGNCSGCRDIALEHADGRSRRCYCFHCFGQVSCDHAGRNGHSYLIERSQLALGNPNEHGRPNEADECVAFASVSLMTSMIDLDGH